MKVGEFNQTVIKKLFRKHFNPENPLELPIAGREFLFDQLKARIAQMSYVWVNRREPQTKYLCHFIINKTKDYYSGYKFLVEFDEENKLKIEYRNVSTHASDIQEIIDFLTVSQNIMRDREIIQSKGDKVFDLQKQAISSHVRKTGVEFVIRDDSRQFKVYVKVPDKKEYFEIKIPYKRFHEILPELETIILSMLTWHKLGVKLRVKAFTYFYGWHGKKHHWSKFIR